MDFVQGDLSGIQNFIFQTVIPEQARKGTAKHLSGRSFWLTLLLDAVCEEIKEKCGLFEPSVLWNTGGKFLILAPNTKVNQGVINLISKNLNEDLLQNLGGILNVNIAMCEAEKEKIQDLPEIIDQLAPLSAVKKKQKFLECGLSFEIMETEKPISQYCNVCGTLISGDGCKACDKYKDIGTKIARAQWLSRGKDLPISFDDFGLFTSYDLIRRMHAPGNYEIHAINST
jgi:CRISPR-associated protein Csm1